MNRQPWETPVIGVKYLYVAQWPDGAIKAGMSRQPVLRRAQLEREHGQCAEWRVVSRPVEHSLCENQLTGPLPPTVRRVK